MGSNDVSSGVTLSPENNNSKVGYQNTFFWGLLMSRALDYQLVRNPIIDQNYRKYFDRLDFVEE